MKKVLIIIFSFTLVGVLYYGISPIFNVTEVNDEVPEEIILLTPPQTTIVPIESGFEDLSSDDQLDMLRQMEAMKEEEPKVMNDSMGPTPSTIPLASAVVATVGHPAEGSVRVFNTTEGAVIRFENFETLNGPNLHLYLSKDLDGEDYIDLGPTKGTVGNINYTVPEGVDLSEYKYVLHWCVPFGVLFNYAELKL